MRAMAREPSAGRDGRFRNIRHAEYEILTALMIDEVLRQRTHDLLRRGVPTGDSVALDRANKALANLSGIFNGMRANRVKNLPDYHIDSEANQ